MFYKETKIPKKKVERFFTFLVHNGGNIDDSLLDANLTEAEFNELSLDDEFFYKLKNLVVKLSRVRTLKMYILQAESGDRIMMKRMLDNMDDLENMVNPWRFPEPDFQFSDREYQFEDDTDSSASASA
jgi:hypothetical protein